MAHIDIEGVNDDAPWKSLTYGVMPSQKMWNEQYREVVGRGVYEMALVGADIVQMEEAYGPPNEGWLDTKHVSKALYKFGRDDLYMVVASLIENAEYQSGDPSYYDDVLDHPSMQLASSILQSLHIEWV